MPENETPDIKSSPRWNKVIRAIIARRPGQEVEHEIRGTLKDAWTAIERQFRRKGYSVNAIVGATLRGDAALLETAFRETHGHRFVKVIAGCEAFMCAPGDLLAEAVARHLYGIRQQVRDLLVHQRHSESFERASARVDPVFDAVAADARTFAKTFIESPKKAARVLRPRLPAASNAVPAGIITMSLLNPAALPKELRP